MEYGTYMLTFFASYIASLAGLYYLSGVILMAEALFLYVHWVKESGSLVELRALFTLAWVGGQGIACLQLSKLQADWNYVTWLCFFLIFGGFGIGYEWGQKYEKVEEKELEKDEEQARRLLHCIIGLMTASILCFAFEAVKVGFIPLFSDEPHAYSYFHVSGVHYFTVSCILIPAITVLYIKVSTKISAGNKLLLLAANVTAVVIPFLCVSRFQLLFAVGFAVVTYIMVNKKIRIRTMVILIVALVPAYVILTVFRHHDVSYLNSIFEMKWEKMPIFITQPYMYVANNYDNFNCLVRELPSHTLGLRQLFPVFALTGLKFLCPGLVNFPIYVTKTELTTVTLIYDAYYDFGILGVLLFGLILGAACRKLAVLQEKGKNPVAYLIYAQIAMYLVFSFFTTWFSNPTTWFWLGVTAIIYIYIGHSQKE